MRTRSQADTASTMSPARGRGAVRKHTPPFQQDLDDENAPPRIKAWRRQKQSPPAAPSSRLTDADESVDTRRRLHLGATSVLVGRDAELHTLHARLSSSIAGRLPDALYLSGAPGVGKTACVRHTLNRFETEGPACRCVFINCMQLRSRADLERSLVEGLQTDAAATPRKKRAVVNDLLTQGADMIVVVLDEMDQLVSRSHDLLYTAFQWPTLPYSRVILIGIANSLDLTERLLPKLKLGAGREPMLMQFKPYSKDDVQAILRQRLLETNELLEPNAVELCARKVSALTGDIRKAIDICQQAVDRTQRQRRLDVLRDCNSATTPARVGCQQVNETVGHVYQPNARRMGASLPLQQKLLFAAALSLSEHGRQQFSQAELSSEYRQACARADVPAVGSSDCAELCQLLESNGLLQISTPSKTDRSKQLIRLLVDRTSARAVLNDNALAAQVLATS